MKLEHLESAGLTLRVLPPRAHAMRYESLLDSYEETIAAIQRFRGEVYRQDNAIPEEALDASGRHFSPFDYENYHLLMVDDTGALAGCFRYRAHPGDIRASDLKLYEIVERMPQALARQYTEALDFCIQQTHLEGLGFSEVGGWAVASSRRRCRGVMTLPFTAWALGQIIGNSRVVAFATSRHDSSKLLRRIGFSLSYKGISLPCFDDPYYGCRMEPVGCNSTKSKPEYAQLVEALRLHLLDSHPWLADSLGSTTGAALPRAA